MKWIPHNAFIIIVLIAFTLCSNTENNKSTTTIKSNLNQKVIKDNNPINQNEMPRFISLEKKEKPKIQKSLSNDDNLDLYMDWDQFFNKEENKKFAVAEKETKEEESISNFIEKGQEQIQKINTFNKVNKKKPGKKGKKGGFNFKVIINEKKSFLNILREKFKGKKGKKKDKMTISSEKKMNRYTKCGIKSGIVLEFLGIKTNKKTLTHEAFMKSTYVELTKRSINLKSDVTSENNLDSAPIYKVLRLKEILRISQQKNLQRYACFDLVHYKNARSEKEDKITLCAENTLSMENWINAIQEFKECQIKVSKINNNDQLVYDFSKVNHLLNMQKTAAKGAAAKASGPLNNRRVQSVMAKSLYYDNVPINVKRPIPISAIGGTGGVTGGKTAPLAKKDQALKKVAKKILNNFRIMRIRQRQVEREFQDKVKVAKEFENKMEKKASDVQRSVEEKVRQQKLQEIEDNLNNEKTKELNLLKAAESKILDMEKSQLKNIKRKYERKYGESMKKAEEKSKEIMNTIIEAKKLTPYEECFDPRLKNFENKEYYSGICKRMFGSHVRILYHIIFQSYFVF
jgi:hypothetical protein